MTDRTEPTAGELRELLAVVLEALDIPNPATVGDTEAHGRILNDRAMHVTIALHAALDEKPVMDIVWTTEYLRERLAEHPPTGYRHNGTARTEAGR